MAVNWDEFHFLAQIHSHLRGDLDLPINSFHVHLFSWVAAIPGGEVNQIVAGRLAMLAIEAGTAAFIALIARRFAGTNAGLEAAAIYLSFGAVIIHGASFRTDPPTTFLLMAALYLIACSRLGWRACLAAAGAAALAALITIKAALFLPSLALAVLWRIMTDPRPAKLVIRLAVCGLAAGAGAAALFAWHKSGLAPSPLGSDVDIAAGAYRKTVLTQQLFPRAAYLKQSLAGSPLQWGLVAAGLYLALRQASLGPDRWRAIALAGLIAPTLSVIVYRNAFPYFFACMLAPACVLAGVSAPLILRRRLIAAAVLAAILIGAATQYAVGARQTQGAQRAVVAAVHQIFPTPVPYLERASMIASFKDVGLFMTTWGMESYRQKGQPIFPPANPADAPVFMIVAHPAQTNALTGAARDGRYDFLPKDEAWLRDNFVQHWGPIWVAGKRFRPGATAFEIFAPGIYTVETALAPQIDGKSVAPGSTLILTAGAHEITAPSAVILRWGDVLKKPIKAPPGGELHRPL